MIKKPVSLPFTIQTGPILKISMMEEILFLKILLVITLLPVPPINPILMVKSVLPVLYQNIFQLLIMHAKNVMRKMNSIQIKEPVNS